MHVSRINLAAQTALTDTNQLVAVELQFLHLHSLLSSMQTVPWVMWINGLMTCLTIFHLAYLGVMFGGDSPDTGDTSSSLEVQAISSTFSICISLFRVTQCCIH